MQLHGNARTTPYIRREMVRRVRDRAEPVTEMAAALGVSARTVYKWLDRYEREGEAGLLDRSSRPTCCPHATSAGVVRQIDKLRRRRLTAWQISRRLAVPRSTVSAWLKRLGLAKLDALEPKPEIVRYEYGSGARVRWKTVLVAGGGGRPRGERGKPKERSVLGLVTICVRLMAT